ncbi:MAG: D-alanyl-D-alanine carboxypeptidase/D-alanyl-D-alanine-endopeptidase [Blastocatellia bacterium]
MKKSFLLVLPLLLLLHAALPGQAPAARKLADRISAVMDTDEYRMSSWGIAVADAATGEMIHTRNPDKLFAPGSVTKLFSGAAALIAMGAPYRFITPIHRRGEVDAAGVLRGDLIVRAVGDPDLSGRTDAQGHLVFTNHDHTYSAMYASQGTTAELTKTDALAGIDDLAQQVAAAGIRQARDVLIDERFFERHESGGSPPFQARPMVVNDHLIDISIAPGREAGAPAIVEFRPQTGYAQFEVAVLTAAPGAASVVNAQRVGPRRYVVRGQIARDQAPVVRTVEVDDGAEFARTVLIERLRARGVSVEASPDSPMQTNSLPAEADYKTLPVVARHKSAPFGESLKVILKVSHNNHAHMLPMLLGAVNGQRTHAEGMRAEQAYLGMAGVDTTRFSLGDGEGGSQANQVSPRAVIQLLTVMAKWPEYQVYHDALPILGVDGTLAEAVGPDSPARGRVHAKTGTYVQGDALNGRLLLRAKAMGGYMTAASGRKLVFAIFLNNVPMNAPAEANKHGATLGRLAEMIQQAL